jgi:hypothetical protein
MIVGNPWKARMFPREVSPYSFVAPKGRANRPNTNLIPSLAVSKTPRTASFTNRKNFDPTGITKMKKAKKSCNPMPQKTTRQLIVLRFSEHIHAKKAKTKIPKKLIRL